MGPLWPWCRIRPKAFIHRSLGQRPRIRWHDKPHWPKAIFSGCFKANSIPDVLFVIVNVVVSKHCAVFVLKRSLSMMLLLVSHVAFRLVTIFRTD